MDVKHKELFQDLVDDNQKWVELSRKTNKFDGIKRLLTDLYPDSAHFIYELLQNAQDASKNNKIPSTVRFILSEKYLGFEHYGEKLFDFEDVKAITAIGEGTKRDDNTSIGKFGAGFKSVFTYTSTPQIHSGNYHFQINDLVVPKKIYDINTENKTLFIFPFNNPEKSHVKARQEIEAELRELGSETLLFLKNINRIELSFSGVDSTGYMHRFDGGNGLVIIRVIIPEKGEKVFYWLRYEKTVAITDETGKTIDCPIAIAFKLEKNDSKDSKSEWKIVSANPGKVCIFFPAEKETSNLMFYIHAPFASTVARDSVRDCEENNRLRDAIAVFAAESLIEIKKRGLLTVEFLGVLPNQWDGLSDFYEPIRKAIVKAFQNEPLVPTKSGSHAPGKNLFIGSASISDVFDDNDLSFLTECKTLWAKNAPQHNQREDRFLGGLGIDTFGREELHDIFSLNDNQNAKKIENWISSKPDQWLLRLYALLETEKIKSAGRLRIVRTKSGELVKASDAFFSVEEGITAPPNICIVKKESYETTGISLREKNAKNFLKNIGVREKYDAATIIKIILSRYEINPHIISISEHIEDIKDFVKFVNLHSDEIQTFKNYPCFLGISKGNRRNWFIADDLFLDKPYMDTGLGSLSSTGKFALWNGYKEMLPEETLSKFINLLKKLDIMHKLDIVAVPVKNNPHFREKLYQPGKRTSNERGQDYTIRNIDMYLETRSIAISRLIWDAIINADKYSAKAVYQPNNDAGYKDADSQLVCSLKEYAWIPDVNGVFHTSNDMTKDMLRDDFPYNNRNGFLEAIGFGHNVTGSGSYIKTVPRATQDKQISQLKAEMEKESAKNLGINNEELEAIKNAKKLGIDFAKILSKASEKENAKRSKPVFPEHKDKNPERRAENISQNHSDGEKITYEKRQRSVRASGSAIDARTRLRLEYTNQDDEMVCQICKDEMPFKGRDGKYYFEAVEAFKIKNESEHNHLALCPLCAAKYKEFIKYNDNSQSQKNFLKAFSESHDLEVPIPLGNEKDSIRFTETHMHDLKTVLETENKL